MVERRDATAPPAGTASRQPCAGGVVFDGAGRLLLVRRGQPPEEGSWSVPGGRCRPGETPQRACVRELGEETGLRVAVVRHAGRVERAAPDGGVYVIDDFVCEVVGGSLQAGDDAADVRWVDRAGLDAVPLARGLFDCLGEWGLLPR